jgi:hypothetical protein
MPRSYSHIYKMIVKDERDVVGHIAYALYKQAKIKHIEKYKTEHDNNDPPEEYLEYFHNVSCLDEEVKRYQLQATSILREFLDNTLSEKADEMEYDIMNEHFDTLQTIVSESETKIKERVAEAEKEIKPRSFWYGVWQSMLGALLFMVLTAGIVFVATFSEKDYTIRFGHGNAKIEEQVQHPQVTDPSISQEFCQ